MTTRTTYVFLYNQDPESQSPDPLLIDWVRAGVYPASGVYTSCVQDAGQIANWSQATITATLSVSASAALETRTSVDGVTWSDWSAASGAIISGTTTLTPSSPSGRYLQYRLTLSSTDPINSPEIGALSLAYFGPRSLAITPAAAVLAPGGAQLFLADVRDVNNVVVSGAPVTWTVVNGGGVIDATGLFTADLPAGVFTDTVLATTSNSVTDTVTVTVLDLPPVADAGGPYSGQEGALVALDPVRLGADGERVMDVLRHDPAVADIPILVIADDPAAFAPDGALQRPFERDDLIQHIYRRLAATPETETERV